ncbi:MAG TPA: hypothetical protein VGI18_03870 [Burkholderiales bacterium]
MTSPFTVRHLKFLLLATWLSVVVAVVTRHEFWRDEVRGLTIAIDASSIGDLMHEGQPMLWHLLLAGAWHLAHSVLVLPIVSVLIAAAAVALMLAKGPFPLWAKALFIFGLPAYEYSVMARNYGISMLLLFAFTALYPSRARHPLVLGVLLALLSNTNVHSAMFVGLLLGIWLRDEWTAGHLDPRSREWKMFCAAALLACAGVGTALWTSWPAGESLAMRGVTLAPGSVWRAAIALAVDPAHRFRELFPSIVFFPSVLPYALAGPLLILALLGLAARPILAVAGCLALGALSIFFTVVYPGDYRHQGLFVVFLVALYWLAASQSTSFEGRWKQRLFVAGLYAGLPLFLACIVATTAAKVDDDWANPVSAGREFGEFLRSRPPYRTAVLLSEPDFLMESMPYYVDNPIYMARERRFGRRVTFSAKVKSALTLSDLMCASWEAQRQTGGPALVVMGGTVARNGLPWETGRRSPVDTSYGRTFAWSDAEVLLWNRHATLLAHLGANVTASDEHYFVYAVTGPAAEEQRQCSVSG